MSDDSQSIERDERFVYAFHLFIKLVDGLCYVGIKYKAHIIVF